MTNPTNQASGVAEPDALGALLNDDTAAAHIYPSTLKTFERGEHFDECWSIKVGNEDETSVGVFTIEQVREALAALATQPAAPAEVVAPVGPVAWVSPEQMFAHEDRAKGEGGGYLPVRKTRDGKFTMALYNDAALNAIETEAFMRGRRVGVKYAGMLAALASPAKAPTDPIRVACVTLDGTTLTVPVDQIGDVLHGEDDQHTYTLTLKTMTRAEFEALGEFDGF